MTDTIRHRGPDDEGFHVDGRVGFGFRRLSILDLSPAGHQPMESGDGGLVLVFNGEIFNYRELREQLEGLGHRFTSSGDTEVLLHAYMQWGRDCLPRLNGMWAFLILDRRRGLVFGSRDRFGIKPLYRYRHGGGVLFASEIKAIRASGRYSGGPNWSMVSRFLTGSSLDMVYRGTETFFEGIEQVAAATAFELKLDGTYEEWRYWSLDDLSRQEIGDPAGAFAELFQDSVRLRMRSHVPVGVSLSGGLDSTAIAATMAKLLRATTPPGAASGLNAFSYITPEYDESAYITETVREAGLVFHRVPIDAAGLWSKLGEVLWYHDEPVHNLNALISFEIYRMAAASGIRVMLNGQGADETIAGYPSYFLDHWQTLLRQGRLREGWQEISAYGAAFGEDGKQLFARIVRRVVQGEARRLAPYRALVRWKNGGGAHHHPWYTAAMQQDVWRDDGSYRATTLDSSLRWALEVAPLPLYLQIEDRNSMAHSVEARVPFLDYRLVSLLFSLPARWKMRGPWNKFLLRESMRGVIPEVVRTRLDKMGYPIPLRKWIGGELYGPMQDVLASSAVRQRGIYDVASIRRDLERHRAGEIDVARGLLNVAQLEAWFQLDSATAEHEPLPLRVPA